MINLHPSQAGNSSTSSRRSLWDDLPLSIPDDDGGDDDDGDDDDNGDDDDDDLAHRTHISFPVLCLQMWSPAICEDFASESVLNGEWSQSET